MKITLEEFLEKNAIVKFFRNNNDATLFYQLLEAKNTFPAVLMMIASFQRYGWLNINKGFGLDIKDNGISIPYSTTEAILNSRLDDALAQIQNIPGLTSDYGAYLVTDIFYYNEDGDSITLRKENELITKVAIYAGSKKKIFRDFMLQFSRNATFSDSLSYILESFILYRFIISSEASKSLKKESMIYSNIYQQNYDKLLYTLRVLNETLNENISSSIISRLNLMKIKSNNDSLIFIKKIKGYDKLGSLVDLLDLIKE